MTNTFAPSPERSRDLRDALGSFATGVTVVTAMTPTGPIGMTANSFSSISLTPPLVLWSPAKSSQRYPYFADAAHFGIHILREDQLAMALEFARQGDVFHLTDWHRTDNDVPLIENCLTSFECATSAIHDAGDHVIIVGEIENVVHRVGAPLVFAQGGFGQYLRQD